MGYYEDVLMALVLITGAVIVVFIIAKYNYLVKNAMIEKGLVSQAGSKKMKYIDLGCILGGLGIGLMMSTIYRELGLTGDTADLLAFGTVLIWGAAGLFTANYFRRKFDNQ